MHSMSENNFFEAVLERLRATRHSDIPAVAAGSGVPESTLMKIRYGEVKNPRIQTVERIHDYFARLDRPVGQPPATGSVATPSEPPTANSESVPAPPNVDASDILTRQGQAVIESLERKPPIGEDGA
jgi:transcriptional regulator with XRE-family HTH domain